MVLVRLCASTLNDMIRRREPPSCLGGALPPFVEPTVFMLRQPHMPSVRNSSMVLPSQSLREKMGLSSVGNWFFLPLPGLAREAIGVVIMVVLGKEVVGLWCGLVWMSCKD